MTVISLQSGSAGNCVYVESGTTSVLVDAGVSGVEVKRRLAAYGRDVRAVRAVVITHDHADHVSSAGVLGRAFRIPVYLTHGTYESARRRFRLDRIPRLHPIVSGAEISVDGITIQTVPTPHDGSDCIGVVVRDRRRCVGVLTDLGHVFPGLAEVVRGLDAAVLESNYDHDMLENGSYPRWLKARIRGPGGHISNTEAASLLAGATGMQWACLAHLSEENNRPHLALAAHRQVLPAGFPLYVASRHSPVFLPPL